MKKLFAALLVTSLALFMTVSVGAGTDKAASLNGWVSDTNCGVKHAQAGGEACIKKCMGHGAKVAFVNDADKSVWGVDNPEVLAGHEGHHVTLQAHVDKEKKSIHVESVAMMK